MLPKNRREQEKSSSLFLRKHLKEIFGFRLIGKVLIFDIRLIGKVRKKTFFLEYPVGGTAKYTVGRYVGRTPC